MYPHLKNDIEIHYIDNYGIALKDTVSRLLSDVDIYIIDKLNGEKSISDIVNEITDELGANDKMQIESIVKEFLKDNPDLIENNCVPNLHAYKKSGVKGKKYPYNIILSLTNECNLVCTHCYKSCSSVNNDFLPYDKLIDTLNHLKNKSKNIQLTGGEPMLHERFFDILNFCVNNFSTTITTSATLVSDENVHNFSGTKDVQVSLYSIDEYEHERVSLTKGSWEKTINGIKLLIKNKIPVTIATIATKSNLSQIEKMINYLIDIGVTGLNIGLLSKWGRGLNLNDEWLINIDERSIAAEMIKELSERYANDINISIWDKKNTRLESDFDFEGLQCGAGLFTWAISEKGNIKPCDFFPDNLFSFGNILQNDIENILDSYNLNGMMKGINEWDKLLKSNNSNLTSVCEMIENYKLHKC